jgi:3-oxoacyl-[acyl-carrier-protein] synthase III
MDDRTFVGCRRQLTERMHLNVVYCLPRCPVLGKADFQPAITNRSVTTRRFVNVAKLVAPHFICHPGGAKVLDAIETALELQNGMLRNEREVLRDHGNMSAPTVLFVLERALKRGLRGSAVLSALGPGFTASFLALNAANGTING